MSLIATVVAAVPAAGAPAEETTWTAIEGLPEPMSLGGSVSDGRGNIYLLGGQTSSGGWVVTNATYVFNTSTQTYAKLAPMPIGAYMPVAGMGPDGLIYVAGGYNRSTQEFLKTIQIYDPSSDSWSFGPEMQFGSFGGFGGFVDGTLYIIGGMDSYTSSHDNVQFFNPMSSTWGIATSMPSEKDQGATVIRDGKIYCIGGIDGTYYSTNTVDVYNAAYNTWSTFAPMPENINAGKGLVGPDGTMYVLGASQHPGGWYFDWATSSWRDLPSFSRSFWGAMGGVGIDGDIYVFGGLNQTGSKKPAVSFSERLDVMDAATDVPSPVVSGTPSLGIVSLTLPFSDPSSFSYQYHLVGPNGVTYQPVYGSTVGNGTFALSITVPVGSPAGEYTLVFDYLALNFEYWSVPVSLAGATFTVQDPTLDEQVNDLKEQLAGMQGQIDELNAKLNQTNSALDADSNKLSGAIDSKADSMFSYLTIVLLVVVITLVALSMARKRA